MQKSQSGKLGEVNENLLLLGEKLDLGLREWMSTQQHYLDKLHREQKSTVLLLIPKSSSLMVSQTARGSTSSNGLTTLQTLP
jgi:hypothetical protein